MQNLSTDFLRYYQRPIAVGTLFSFLTLWFTSLLSRIGPMVYEPSWVGQVQSMPAPAARRSKLPRLQTYLRIPAEPTVRTPQLLPSFMPEPTLYQPYAVLGGRGYLNEAVLFTNQQELFIPLGQFEQGLLFTDLHLSIAGRQAVAGSFQLGYRQRLHELDCGWGFHLSYDLQRERAADLQQISVGGEFWQRGWFFNFNLYCPFGQQQLVVAERVLRRDELSAAGSTQELIVSFRGLDTEIGYALSEHWTGAVGGYQFSSNYGNCTGSALRLNYHHQINPNQSLHSLSYIHYEAGVRYDRCRGLNGYLGLGLKFSLEPETLATTPSGFAPQMAGMIQRNPGILTLKGGPDSGQTFELQCAESVAKPHSSEAQLLVAELSTLGLSANATLEEVQHRFRMLAQKLHPDRAGADPTQATQAFVELMRRKDRVIGLLYRVRGRPTGTVHSEHNGFSFTRSAASYTAPFPAAADTVDTTSGREVKPAHQTWYPVVSIHRPLNLAVPNHQQVNGSALLGSDLTCCLRYLRGFVQNIFQPFLALPLARAQELKSSAALSTFEPDQTLDFNQLTRCLGQETGLLDVLTPLANAVGDLEYQEEDFTRLLVLLKQQPMVLTDQPWQLLESLVLDERITEKIALRQQLTEILFRELLPHRYHSASAVFETLFAQALQDSGMRQVVIATFLHLLAERGELWRGYPAMCQEFTHRLSELLPYDTSLALVEALLRAHRLYGFTANLNALHTLGQLLTSAKFTPRISQQELENFILSSLEAMLDTHEVDRKLSSAQLAQLDHLLLALPESLVLVDRLLERIFALYTQDSQSLEKFVFKVLAESRALDPAFLELLITKNRAKRYPLAVIPDKKRQMFLALRIVQHHLVLPAEVLTELMAVLPYHPRCYGWLGRLWRSFSDQFTCRNRDQVGDDSLQARVAWFLEIVRQTPGSTMVKEELLPRLVAFYPQASAWLKVRMLNFTRDNLETMTLVLPERSGIRCSREELVQRLATYHHYLATDQGELLLASLLELINHWLWPVDWILRFITQRSQASEREIVTARLDQIATLLSKLATYQISYAGECDRQGLTADVLLETVELAQALGAIERLIRDNHFFTRKASTELLAELRRENAENSNLVKLIDSGYFERILRRIRETVVIRGVEKPLPDWKGENILAPGDYLRWRRSLTQVDYADEDFLVEAMSVLSQAAALTILKRNTRRLYYPREGQLISVLINLGIYRSGGVIMQIGTGEGKTLTLAMLAVLRVLQGRKIDIMTSYGALAMRDAKDTTAFYQYFGITSSHNIVEASKLSPRSCYKSDVVYGDMSHFNGDAIKDLLYNTRDGRVCDYLFLDEGDLLAIDLSRMKIQVASVTPGMQWLQPFYVQLLVQAYWRRDLMYEDFQHRRCYVKHPLPPMCRGNQSVPEADEWRFELVGYQATCGQVLLDSLEQFAQSQLFNFDQHLRYKRSFVVPRHLEASFLPQQLRHWLHSLLLSLSNKYIYKIHYVIDQQSEGSLAGIVPVDLNNGAFQYNLRLADGLHQFLELQHGLVLTTESLISTYMSYHGFINRYNARLFVTGTIGERWHQAFANQVYGTAPVIVPSFAYKDVVIMPPSYHADLKAWEAKIITRIQQVAVRERRAVLVVMPSVAQVEKLIHALRQSGYIEPLYQFGVAKEHEDFNPRQVLGAKQTVISTNVASRGMDLQLAPSVLAAGGLHVIVTYVPRNLRMMQQIYGRTARQGAPGSVETIVSLQQLQEDFPNLTTACITHLINGSSRDDACLQEVVYTADRAERAQDLEVRLPVTQLVDHLFEAYIDLMRSLDSPIGYRLLVGNLEERCEPYGLYLSLHAAEQSIWLRICDGNGSVAQLDITEMLRIVDRDTARHITHTLAELSKQERYVGFKLSQQAFEVIYFLAASHSYIRNVTTLPTYARVCWKLEREIQADVAPLHLWSAKRVAEPASVKYWQAFLQHPDYQDLFGPTRECDLETIAKLKLRRMFHLWQEDRKLYAQQYELRQLNDYWSLFLHEQVYAVLGDLQTESRFMQRQELDKIEQQIQRALVGFSQEMTVRFEQKNFLTNEIYLVLKAWNNLRIYYNLPLPPPGETTGYYRDERILVEAVQFAEQAINIEEIYTWQAHNVLAYLRLLKDGKDLRWTTQLSGVIVVGERFIKDLQAAVNNLANLIIPGYLTTLTSLRLLPQHEPFDDSEIELIARIEVCKQYIDQFQQAIEITATGLKSGHQMVENGKLVDLEPRLRNIDLFESALKNIAKQKEGGVLDFGNTASAELLATLTSNVSVSGFNNSLREQVRAKVNSRRTAIFKKVLAEFNQQGGLLLETKLYALEEPPKDWFGTIVSGLVGAVLIYAATLIPGVGAALGFGAVFRNIFATAVLMKGIGDILATVISFATDTPMSLSAYLKGSAISLGVSVATAGLLQFTNYLAHGIKFLELLKFSSGQIPRLALIQSAVTGASLATYALAARRLVSTAAIQQHAQEAIERVIVRQESALQRLVAGGLLPELYAAVGTIVANHIDRFTNTLANAALSLGVSTAGHLASGIPYVGPIINQVLQGGASLTQLLLKNAEAMPVIMRELEQKIQQLALSVNKLTLLQHRIERTFGVEAKTLLTALKEQGLMAQSELACAALDQLNLAKVTLRRERMGYKNGIRDLCLEVEKKLIDKYDYHELKEIFVSQVVADLTQVRKQIAEVGNNVGVNIAAEIVQMAVNVRRQRQDEDRQRRQEELDFVRQLDEDLQQDWADVVAEARVIEHGWWDSRRRYTSKGGLSTLMYDRVKSSLVPAVTSTMQTKPGVGYSRRPPAAANAPVMEVQDRSILFNDKLRLAFEVAYLAYELKEINLEPGKTLSRADAVRYQKILQDPTFKLLKSDNYVLVASKHDRLTGVDMVAIGQRVGQEIANIMYGTAGTRIWDHGDLINAVDLVMYEIPLQYACAKGFLKQVIQAYPRAEIILTGHSSGGVSAQLLGMIFGFRAVAFESPGVKQIMNHLLKLELPYSYELERKHLAELIKENMPVTSGIKDRLNLKLEQIINQAGIGIGKTLRDDLIAQAGGATIRDVAAFDRVIAAKRSDVMARAKEKLLIVNSVKNIINNYGEQLIDPMVIDNGKPFRSDFLPHAGSANSHSIADMESAIAVDGKLTRYFMDNHGRVVISREEYEQDRDRYDRQIKQRYMIPVLGLSYEDENLLPTYEDYYRSILQNLRETTSPAALSSLSDERTQSLKLAA